MSLIQEGTPMLVSVTDVLEAGAKGLVPAMDALTYYLHNHALDDAFLAAFAVVGTHLSRQKWGESYEEYMEMQAATPAEEGADTYFDDEYENYFDDFDLFEDENDFRYSNRRRSSFDDIDDSYRSTRRRRGPQRRAPLDRRLPPARDGKDFNEDFW